MAEIDKKEARLDALAVPREEEKRKKNTCARSVCGSTLVMFFGSAVVLLFATPSADKGVNSFRFWPPQHQPAPILDLLFTTTHTQYKDRPKYSWCDCSSVVLE